MPVFLREIHHEERGNRMMTTTEQVWEAFHTPLQHFIRRRVPDDPTAEDLLQEVFLKIHLHIGGLKDARQLESWLYRLTRNSIIDYYRTARQVVTLESAGDLTLPEELPDDIVSELLPSVRAMVYNLRPQDRQALVLTEYHGLTQKELAERLGISLSGAKSRVQRARERLKQQLLDCCHFELDRRGHILDYQSRCHCCVEGSCCMPTASDEAQSRPSLHPVPRSFLTLAANPRPMRASGTQAGGSPSPS
jgi:RNA polymerase sigma-70 factor, ECF subfamily